MPVVLYKPLIRSLNLKLARSYLDVKCSSGLVVTSLDSRPLSKMLSQLASTLPCSCAFFLPTSRTHHAAMLLDSMDVPPDCYITYRHVRASRLPLLVHPLSLSLSLSLYRSFVNPLLSPNHPPWKGPHPKQGLKPALQRARARPTEDPESVSSATVPDMMGLASRVLSNNFWSSAVS